MVCTRCMTYNQAPFIKDALQGFCSQNVSFPSLYIIVDDASTDGEQAVLKQWAEDNLSFIQEDGAFKKNAVFGFELFSQYKENKNLFFLIILLKENHYGQGKSRINYFESYCRQAKYQAICDGDDYWCDSYKLKLQVDYMENHPECSACSTNAIVINEKKENKGIFSDKPSRYITNMDEIVIQRQFHTASVLWREPYDTIKGSWDTHIWCSLLTQGKIWYDNRVTCAYRKAGQGVTNTTPKLKWVETNENWSNILYEQFGPKALSYTGAYLSLTRDILSLLILNKTLSEEEKRIMKCKYHKYANWEINIKNVPFLFKLYRSKWITIVRKGL